MTGTAWPRAGSAAVCPNLLEVAPGRALRGRLRVPGDKSISHRALLLAGRADGLSVIRGLSTGDDVRRTAMAMLTVGADIDADDVAAEVRITGGVGRLHEPDQAIDVGNSGTAIRLLAGWLAAFPWFSVLYGDASVSRRPMDRISEPLRRMGAAVDGREGGRLPPLSIRGGRLTGIDLRMPVASAQVKSAALLAGLGATSPTTVREPAPTRAHTEEMLAACGADITVSDDGLVVQLRASRLQPFHLEVPGDPSQAAFWIVAGCIVPGSELTVERVYVGRARAGFLDVLRRMGADIEVVPLDATTADIRVRYGVLHGTTVGGADVAGLIDEIPALAVAAAVAEGPTEFRDAAELAVKETDRIATITSQLGALGAAVEARPDGLLVAGGGGLRAATLQSHGDHRIAMAMAIAALVADGPSQVEGWEAVGTSYPGFAEDLEALSS